MPRLSHVRKSLVAISQEFYRRCLRAKREEVSQAHPAVADFHSRHHHRIHPDAHIGRGLIRTALLIPVEQLLRGRVVGERFKCAANYLRNLRNASRHAGKVSILRNLCHHDNPEENCYPAEDHPVFAFHGVRPPLAEVSAFSSLQVNEPVGNAFLVGDSLPPKYFIDVPDHIPPGKLGALRPILSFCNNAKVIQSVTASTRNGNDVVNFVCFVGKFLSGFFFPSSNDHQSSSLPDSSRLASPRYVYEQPSQKTDYRCGTDPRLLGFSDLVSQDPNANGEEHPFQIVPSRLPTLHESREVQNEEHHKQYINDWLDIWRHGDEVSNLGVSPFLSLQVNNLVGGIARSLRGPVADWIRRLFPKQVQASSILAGASFSIFPLRLRAKLADLCHRSASFAPRQSEVFA
jgi:hypothetical protein